MNELTRVFAVDLDGTLLHQEPEAIAVWGRSGYRYLGMAAAMLLEEISKKIPLVIATGRNAKSVRGLTDQLPNVRFHGFVLENGMVARTSLGNEAFEDKWTDVMAHLSGWERLAGYECCLGLIPPSSVNNSESVMRKILADIGRPGYLLKDRHKLFVYPLPPSKMSGFRSLMAKPLIALGDECNDLDMLDSADFAATMNSAHEDVRHLILKKNGYCSSLSSHAGAEDLLKWVKRNLRQF